MTFQTDTLRRTHASLGRTAALLVETARSFDGLVPHEREARLAEALRALRDDVLTHVDLDEAALYPELAEHLDDSLAVAFMRDDHAAIREWIERLVGAGLDGDPELVVQRLYELHALIALHVRREERLYLSALEARPRPGES